MIHFNKKKEMILIYIRDGKSQRQISKETGVSRETIRKYIRNYEEKLSEFNKNLTEEDKINIIDAITSKPIYTSSSRRMSKRD